MKSFEVAFIKAILKIKPGKLIDAPSFIGIDTCADFERIIIANYWQAPDPGCKRHRLARDVELASLGVI